MSALAAFTNLRAFRRDPLAFFGDVAGRSGAGSVRAVPLGVRRAVVVTDPAVVAVALDHAALVRDRRPMGPLGAFGGYAPVHEVIGDGLPLLSGDAVPARRRRVGGLMKDALGVDAGLAAPVLAPGDVDVLALASREVLRRLCLRLFGDACEPLLDDIAGAVLDTAHSGHRQSLATPSWSRLVGKDVAAIASARARLLRVARTILDDDAFGGCAFRRSFADAPRSEQEDELVTQLLAGAETTSLSVCFTLWLLAGHDGWRARATADARAIVAGDVDVRTLRLSDERAIVRCLREALRLYPPFWQLFRVATAPLTLGDVDVATDDLVFCCIYLANRAGLADADAFRPDEGARSALPFLSFGVGGRACIGARLGFQVALEVTAVLLATTSLVPRSTVIQPLPLMHGLSRRGGFIATAV